MDLREIAMFYSIFVDYAGPLNTDLSQDFVLDWSFVCLATPIWMSRNLTQISRMSTAVPWDRFNRLEPILIYGWFGWYLLYCTFVETHLQSLHYQTHYGTKATSIPTLFLTTVLTWLHWSTSPDVGPLCPKVTSTTNPPTFFSRPCELTYILISFRSGHDIKSPSLGLCLLGTALCWVSLQRSECSLRLALSAAIYNRSYHVVRYELTLLKCTSRTF